VKHEGQANSIVGAVQKKSKFYSINHNSLNSKVAEMDPGPDAKDGY
jgi:hypothetical protein